MKMASNQYLALLRGINVGGNNLIKMSELKSGFEDMGFTEVLTYIQSGNVVFTSTLGDINKITILIEKALSVRFGYNSKVVTVSKKQLNEVVSKAPEGFGLKPDTYRYDVIFTKDPLRPSDLYNKLRLKMGVDEAFKGDIVIYFQRIKDEASKSYLSRLVLMPEYQHVTVRNWNTTFKLASLMNANFIPESKNT